MRTIDRRSTHCISVLAAVAALFAVPIQAQTITTVAGSGVADFCGDESAAASACLRFPQAVAVDSAGNLFIADHHNNRIRKVDSAGRITTIAGNGTPGYCGDNGPAISACLFRPGGLVVDVWGSLFIADTENGRIRKVDATGTITTVAGGGPGTDFCGDSGPAIAACLYRPEDVTVDADGNLFIADRGHFRIRKVDLNGTITTVAGSGHLGCGSTGPAVDACIDPFAVAVDASGNLFIADYSAFIFKVDPSGMLAIFAGGAYGFCGDGGPAINACLALPTDVELDVSGNLFIADEGNQRIRKVNPAGTITTVAGNGIADFCGDGGPATEACLYFPHRTAIDAAGNVFVADSFNHRIREVLSPGTVTIDVKPGSCTNPINVRARGVLPVVILGTADFDVAKIDLSSIALEGVPAIRGSIEDVTRPPDIAAGDMCGPLLADGFPDLTLKFDNESIVAALILSNEGPTRVLRLTGRLKPQFGGAPIHGQDTVLLKGR